MWRLNGHTSMALVCAAPSFQTWASTSTGGTRCRWAWSVCLMEKESARRNNVEKAQAKAGIIPRCGVHFSAQRGVSRQAVAGKALRGWARIQPLSSASSGLLERKNAAVLLLMRKEEEDVWPRDEVRRCERTAWSRSCHQCAEMNTKVERREQV